MDKSKEAKLMELCECKDTLLCWLKTAIAKGMDECDAKELGEVVDMIKDCAEAEKLCREALYYETVTEAMEDAGEYDDRMGYNHYHTNSGRFATKGNGHMVRGYNPTVEQMPYVGAYIRDPNGFRDEMRDRMGYMEPDYRRPGYDFDETVDRYGRAYKEFKDAKRHYTKTNSPVDKEEMEHRSNEHMANLITATREMYQSAEPALKQRMKTDLMGLMNEMK